MRARDASRPTEDDLAAAERDLVIVQRHYVPTESLPDAVAPARQQAAAGARPARRVRPRPARGGTYSEGSAE
jgi:hypothetical protein